MKRISILCCSLLISVLSIGNASERKTPSQESTLLVNESAPNFTATAVADGKIFDFSLQDYRGKYVILLFYPLDFTFVCPTELHAFQNKLQEFNSRNAQLLACSVDSPYTHLAWLNTQRCKGGIEGIEYPIISDLDKSISRSFHVLNEKEGIALRGLFVIDRDGIVRHQLVNDLPIGRNVDEVLRFLDALITFETQGEVCPANWKLGDKTLKPTADGVIDYFNESE